jgi:hypothetical protein
VGAAADTAAAVASTAAVVDFTAAWPYAYEGDRLVLGGGLSAHKHVFKSELKSG